jgi:hypothetical protein
LANAEMANRHASLNSINAKERRGSMDNIISQAGGSGRTGSLLDFKEAMKTNSSKQRLDSGQLNRRGSSGMLDAMQGMAGGGGAPSPKNRRGSSSMIPNNRRGSSSMVSNRRGSSSMVQGVSHGGNRRGSFQHSLLTGDTSSFIQEENAPAADRGGSAHHGGGMKIEGGTHQIGLTPQVYCYCFPP